MPGRTAATHALSHPRSRRHRRTSRAWKTAGQRPRTPTSAGQSRPRTVRAPPLPSPQHCPLHQSHQSRGDRWAAAANATAAGEFSNAMQPRSLTSIARDHVQMARPRELPTEAASRTQCAKTRSLVSQRPQASLAPVVAPTLAAWRPGAQRQAGWPPQWARLAGLAPVAQQLHHLRPPSPPPSFHLPLQPRDVRPVQPPLAASWTTSVSPRRCRAGVDPPHTTCGRRGS
mmetsp:Transcript_26262/g.84509  ORF Transcript_26262/g.84509 Transcript_26262/m.84509 type:complete len:229 (+) Transcript_26262:1018-1704(+)